MNLKTFLGLAAVAVLAIATFQFANATTLNAAQDQAQQEESPGIKYARLVVTENGEKTTWLVGGINTVPRTEALRTTYRKLGGKQKSTLANLLDQIGSENWRLVQKDGDTWIFSQDGQ